MRHICSARRYAEFIFSIEDREEARRQRGKLFCKKIEQKIGSLAFGLHLLWRVRLHIPFSQDRMKQLQMLWPGKSPKELEDYLFQLGKTRQVYYMGLNYIGEETLEHAIERMESDICLIYLGNGMAFYQEEQDKLPTPRYLLIRKR